MSYLRQIMKDIAIDNIDGMDRDEARYYLENEAIPVSGSVSGLIYYADTEPYAQEFHDEIIELMEEIYDKEIPSELLTLNAMTWFAFEYLLSGMVDEIIEEVYGDEEDLEEEEEWDTSWVDEQLEGKA